MSDQRVRRVRKKRKTPAKLLLVFLCAAVVATFAYDGGSKAVTVNVPSANNTGGGWGDSTNAQAQAAKAKAESSVTPKPPQKTLSLDNCKKLAYAASDPLDTLNDKLAVKQANYEDKVKAAEVKIEYVKHFHWKFLFSFDFPRDLTFEELRQVAYEPKEALQEVKQVKEDMNALKMDLDEKVTELYIEVYKGRQYDEIYNERLLLAQDEVAKVSAMLATGEKTEEDLKQVQQKVKDLESAITSNIRTTDGYAKKLGKQIGLVDEYGNLSDPTLSGYKLNVPYSTEIINKLDRSQLGYIQRYTLDHDSSIFEARGNKSLAYVDVTTVYSAIERNMQYHDMLIIKPFYDAVIAGRTINKRDLKNANKQFLHAIDVYWEGYYRIGFFPFLFKFDKEWFKGKADGTWYMMDSPDALYEAILEYSEATKELKDAEDDKNTQVEDAFNSYVGLKTSLLTLREQKEAKEADFKEAKIEYRIGEITANEYNAILSSYEDLQVQELDSLVTFSENVNSFNRVTCGCLNHILAGDDLDNEFGPQLVVANDIPGASYYIVPKYEELVFSIGVSVPDDFKYNITDFELWCDGTKIGQKTAVGEVITHLMQSTADVEKVVVRVFDGENFVADCQIDPGVLQGPLDIPEYKGNTKLENQVGTYEITENTERGTITLKLVPDAIENMGYFIIYDTNGKAVGGEEKQKCDEGIQYLNALMTDIGSVTVKCFDKDENYLYDATFNVEAKAVIKKVE